MTHHAPPNFGACYRSLSPDVQKLADEAYARLKQDPRHPSYEPPSSRRTSRAPSASAWSFIFAISRGSGFIPQSVVR